MGMAFSLCLALVIIAGSIPRWIVSPCDEMSVKRFQLAAVGIIAVLSVVPAWSLTKLTTPLAPGWTWPPVVWIPLLLAAILYGIGITKMLRRAAHRRSSCGRYSGSHLGWISLVIALDSPLHELGEQLFWVHMTQHEILMLISAPLLVLGQPPESRSCGPCLQLARDGGGPRTLTNL